MKTIIILDTQLNNINKLLKKPYAFPLHTHNQLIFIVIEALKSVEFADTWQGFYLARRPDPEARLPHSFHLSPG